jgi:putative FmdB family regulatory protein
MLLSGLSQPAKIISTMPLYEYECKKCGHRFEKILKFSDKPMKKCPDCGGAVEQLISAATVQFKGAGWYVTDYAKKGTSSGKPSESDSGSKDTSKDSQQDSKETRDSKETKKEEKPKAETGHKKHKKE